MTSSLQARVVYPLDGPPIEHGFVTVAGERIVAVGPRAEAGARVVDVGNVALLPGLVNAHTHLEFSHLQHPLGRAGMPLAEWIRLVIAERQRGGGVASTAIAAGLAESVRWGVTSLGDIGPSDGCAGADSPLDVSHFFEVIGFSRRRAESAFTAIRQRLERLGASPARVGISPHAPYTVSPKLLRNLVALARQRDMPVAMHLAESAEELEFLAAGTGPLQQLLDERSMWDPAAVPRGSRPLDYLRLLAEAPRAVVIHGNFLDAEERSFLADHGDRMSLVFCPRTHGYFGHPPYPLSELLDSGVRVALGTDSRASNPDLDLLAEMRRVAVQLPALRPHDIVCMGTLAGAEALGRAHEVGSLAPGKLANLIAVPLAAAADDDPEECLAGLLHTSDRPCAVWWRGRQV